MPPHEFIQKWQAAQLSERSACQQHFLDLCDLLAQPKPATADPTGTWYTFERGVSKTDGGQGWADVWLRHHFGWEYKGKHKDLAAAYKQLLQYREDLENPPLLIVCDLDRFEIHTNFTGTAKVVHKFSLAELAEPKNLDLLPGSPNGPWKRYIVGQAVPDGPSGHEERQAQPDLLAATSRNPKSEIKPPSSATPAPSPKTKSAPPTSKNARSPTSTTSARPGSTSPTKNSIPPSSPPTTGTHP